MFESGLIDVGDKVHVVAVYSNDNGGLHFNRKISSLGNLKGLKVRVPGPGQARVLKALGLVPVGMGAMCALLGGSVADAEKLAEEAATDPATRATDSPLAIPKNTRIGKYSESNGCIQSPQISALVRPQNTADTRQTETFTHPPTIYSPTMTK